MNYLSISLFFIFFCTTLVFGFNVHLNPDPNVLAVGHRPAGMPLAILCIVDGLDNKSKPGIVWTKSQADISKTGNVELKKIDSFTLGLHIQNSSVEDSGIYICTASFKKKTHSVHVDVNIFEELKFLDKYDEVLPTEGASLNISCRVKTKFTENEIITMWEKGIIALTNSSIANGYKFYKNNQILEINNYDSTLHEGLYQCKVFDKRTGLVISRQIKIGGVQKKRLEFCENLCTTLCTNLSKSNSNTVQHTKN